MRRSEIFCRIDSKDLSNLFNEYEDNEEENIEDNLVNYQNNLYEQGIGYNDRERGNNREGGIYSLMNYGSGSSSYQVRIVEHDSASIPEYNKPYIILDLRECNAQEFNHCHIKGSIHYPQSLLTRHQMSLNLTSYGINLNQYKNQEERLIILYCNDEKISTIVGKALVDRDISNVFVLTGGLDEFKKQYPQYIEGGITKTNDFLSLSRRDGPPSARSGTGSVRSVTGSVRGGTGSIRGGTSLQSLPENRSYSQSNTPRSGTFSLTSDRLKQLEATRQGSAMASASSASVRSDATFRTGKSGKNCYFLYISSQ